MTIDEIDLAAPLSPILAGVLASLAANPGRLVRNRELMCLHWTGQDDDRAANSLKVAICKIRKALPRSIRIETVFGQGYRLTAAPEDLA